MPKCFSGFYNGFAAQLTAHVYFPSEADQLLATTGFASLAQPPSEAALFLEFWHFPYVKRACTIFFSVISRVWRVHRICS